MQISFVNLGVVWLNVQEAMEFAITACYASRADNSYKIQIDL